MRLQLRSSRNEALAWADLLEQRVAQRTQELEALYAVSREISSQLAIQDVFTLDHAEDARAVGLRGGLPMCVERDGPDDGVARHLVGRRKRSKNVLRRFTTQRLTKCWEARGRCAAMDQGCHGCVRSWPHHIALAISQRR